ncbi:glyoxalase/bleomycin resistance/dioxygenase family protein [Pontibacillus yanchengensis]|uniref:Glyoxalase n=1 Tax=Pontibacillus yanchengensis Y32 TaxID=1385514 RepID=A0A0A2T9K8_9BACI|nr:glyoxalase/bleomycin resistance/dioxygenase family protein [Pontibacillus yanchengensis]KGP72229.1 hypothetical protein N782_08230 [Pontibacillus yanchengensis Y32]
MTIKQLEAIRIPAKNLEETKDWYESNFQFEAISEDMDEVAFTFQEGANLIFYKSEMNHMYPFSPLNINVFDPQTLHRDLFLKGCKLTDIEDFYDMVSYEVTDPNELQIGIVGWGDHSGNQRAFHIGGYFLPVEQLERSSKWYQQHLGVQELYQFSFNTPMYGELRAVTLDHIGITLVEVPRDLFIRLDHPFTLGSNDIKADYDTLHSRGLLVTIDNNGEAFSFQDGEGHTIHVSQLK